MTDKSLPTGPFGREDPALPRVFGRYLLVQRLSRGGMGEIFLAKHGLAGFEKLAIIKKVLPHLAADEQFISRFVDEAQVAIKLAHVNIAQVFEVGRVGDEYFLALEYVEGRDLRRTLSLLGHRKQRMPVDLALFVARELANGLAYAHRRTGADGTSLGLVHCDISPPNVLVSFEGETKLIDFGIAKSALRGTATDPKLGFGKFGYMAPEQLIRGGVVDARTDIYAAGVVLFELLTNHRLYEPGPQPDYRALARKVSRGEHPLPSEHDPALARYDDLVATALRPKLEERYQTAAELRDAIQQALVAVNPTISTDQLGAFMRDLFAAEMTAQRELHDRVASTHLADFQEQLHTQTISTVSFAATQLPLPAPPPAPPPRPGAPRPGAPRTTGPQRTLTGPQRSLAAPQRSLAAPPRTSTPLPVPMPTGPRSSPAFDTMAPPTDALPELDELALAEGTNLAPPRPAHRRRRIANVGGGIALGAGIAALVVVLGARPGGRRAADGTAQVAAGSGSEGKKQAITIVPIDPPPGSPPAGVSGAAAPAGAGGAVGSAGGSGSSGSAEAAGSAGLARAPQKGSAEEIEMPTLKVGSAPAPGANTGANTGAAGLRPVRPRPRGDARDSKKDGEKKELTRELVAAKYSSARREYAAFKTRNGDRLEREWGDLATFITYQLTPGNFEDAMRRIESFRARLRE
jgi:serine/threonine protein kinase